MRPDWFWDSIPLDTLIAPMVLFFQNHGITTINSCQGGRGHLYGRPTIGFIAHNLDDIDRVHALLSKHELDISLEVGLMTGYFAEKSQLDGFGKRYGKASWLWAYEGGKNCFIEVVYNRVIKLVDMNEIKDITRDHEEWVAAGYPRIG